MMTALAAIVGGLLVPVAALATDFASFVRREDGMLGDTPGDTLIVVGSAASVVLLWGAAAALLGCSAVDLVRIALAWA